MKITKSNNQAFGIITKEAIDTIRKHSEGYIYRPKYLKEPTGACYSADTKYSFMNKDELMRLKALTQKAQSLKKVIIGSLHSNSKEGLSIEYPSGDEYCVRFNKKDEGNIKAVLDKFECAIDFAQEHESEATGDFYQIKKGSTFLGYGTVYSNLDMPSDKFRTDEENKIIKSIYDSTLNLEKGKFSTNTCDDW